MSDDDTDVVLAVAFNDIVRQHFRSHGDGLVSCRAVVVACCSVLTGYIDAVEDDAGKADLVAWVHECLTDHVFGARH